MGGTVPALIALVIDDVEGRESLELGVRGSLVQIQSSRPFLLGKSGNLMIGPFVFLPFDSLRLSIGASNAYQLTYLTSMKTGFE